MVFLPRSLKASASRLKNYWGEGGTETATYSIRTLFVNEIRNAGLKIPHFSACILLIVTLIRFRYPEQQTAQFLKTRQFENKRWNICRNIIFQVRGQKVLVRRKMRE
jgi:hypothetical protein